MIDVLVGDKNMRDGLITQFRLERREVVAVARSGIDHGHASAADDERSSSRSGEPPWVGRDQAPDQGRHDVRLAVREREFFLERDHRSLFCPNSRTNSPSAAPSFRLARILSTNGKASGGMSVLLTSTM